MLSADDKRFVEMIRPTEDFKWAKLLIGGEDLRRLFSIIDKQEKALEKCKEQRDRLHWWHTSGWYNAETYKDEVDKDNKELSEILKE